MIALIVTRRFLSMVHILSWTDFHCRRMRFRCLFLFLFCFCSLLLLFLLLIVCLFVFFYFILFYFFNRLKVGISQHTPGLLRLFRPFVRRNCRPLLLRFDYKDMVSILNTKSIERVLQGDTNFYQIKLCKSPVGWS